MIFKNGRIEVVPLKYGTWKIQCKMALIKEGLWSNVDDIVDETETAPVDEGALAKFVGRKNKALVTIVLSMDPGLLYVVGADPTDPSVVWKVLANQFVKLELKRKLFSINEIGRRRLAEGGSVQAHVKAMTELCDEVVGEPVKEEDRVLLASLPESYNVLVTVTERLLHEEVKKKNSRSSEEGGLVAHTSLLHRPPPQATLRGLLQVAHACA